MSFNPVAFATIPTQTYSDRFSPPAGQQLQAGPMDANFAALNTELRRQPTASSWVYRSYMVNAMTSGFAAGAWTDFPVATWAPISVTVPECTALHVAIGASGYNNHSGTSYLWVGAEVTGSAVRVGGLLLRTRYSYDGGYWSSAKTWRIGTELSVGGVLTLSPQYLASLSSAGHIGASRGMISIMALM
jgi:hypothetical protein